MPLLNINGTNVEFPFEPYPCQVSYMENVITCLKNVSFDSESQVFVLKIIGMS